MPYNNKIYQMAKTVLENKREKNQYLLEKRREEITNKLPQYLEVKNKTLSLFNDYMKNSSTYSKEQTEEIKEKCSFTDDLVNIKLIVSGEEGNKGYTRFLTEYEDEGYNDLSEEIMINNVCKSSKEWFVKIPDTSGCYVKINAEKDEKYQNGY